MNDDVKAVTKKRQVKLLMVEPDSKVYSMFMALVLTLHLVMELLLQGQLCYK